MGTEVFIAATEDSKALVERNGLTYIKARGDVAALIRDGGADEAVQADNIFKFVKSLSNKRLKAALLDITEDLYRACEGMDLIIYHPGTAVGAFAGEDFGIPAIVGSPFPLTVTGDYPSLLFYHPKPPPIFNRLSHIMTASGLFFASKGCIRRLYKERLTVSRRRFPNPLRSKQVKLISCSSTVFPVKPPSVAKGWWFLDEDYYRPPDDLADFLAKGDAPVYIGFGSIGSAVQSKETAELFAEVLKRSGRRAVIASAGGAFAAVRASAALKAGSGRIYFLQEAPHSYLFPRMSMVIHHGGAGTSAAGFRAGVPSIIIPRGNDQFAWARRAYELGIGVEPLDAERLTVDSLVSAIEAAGKPAVRVRAKEFGERIRAENGAVDTAGYILAGFT
jgi:sterol 3beta-glucosyltransferase